MNIVYSTTMTDVSPDTFVTFPGGGDFLYGPGTLVWIIHTSLDTDQTLDVRVIELGEYTSSSYVLEEASVAGDPSSYTGFQSTPLPLPAAGWGTLLGVTIAGGTNAHHIYVAAIAL